MFGFSQVPIRKISVDTVRVRWMVNVMYCTRSYDGQSAPTIFVSTERDWTFEADTLTFYTRNTVLLLCSRRISGPSAWRVVWGL